MGPLQSAACSALIFDPNIQERFLEEDFFTKSAPIVELLNAIIAKCYGNDRAKFEAEIGVGPDDAEFAKVWLAFQNVMGEQFGRPLTRLESENLVDLYEGEMLKHDYLILWRAIPEGAKYLRNHPDVENLSFVEVKKSFKKWLQENPQEIEFLFLGKENLHHLPLEIGELSQLRRPHLCENNLNELPAEIGRLTQLNTLTLNKNNLTELPVEIGKLPQLEFLNVSDNKLTKLPVVINSLSPNTRVLILNNFISELPERLKQQPQYTSLPKLQPKTLGSSLPVQPETKLESNSSDIAKTEEGSSSERIPSLDEGRSNSIKMGLAAMFVGAVGVALYSLIENLPDILGE